MEGADGIFTMSFFLFYTNIVFGWKPQEKNTIQGAALRMAYVHSYIGAILGEQILQR